MKIDLKELEEFLKASNKSSYANKDAPKAESLRPRSEDYHFEKDGLIYHDTYFGARDFIGEEVIYKNGEPVWGANYYGFILEPTIEAEDVYDVLRAAMIQDDDTTLPIRGPKEYIEGNNKYENREEGSLDRFSGIEEISINGTVVYRAYYHGGFIE